MTANQIALFLFHSKIDHCYRIAPLVFALTKRTNKSHM